jgi:hypothetical protein
MISRAIHRPGGVLRFRVVHGVAGKLFVAFLLTLCVALYLLEMSGRWDRSIQDANDEAGFVAIVLCIGVAVSVAGSLVARMRASRTAARVPLTTLPAPERYEHPRIAWPASASSPPLSLRI